ncbi:MAG: SPOR domain-containing protein [Phenylobacterium sp.]|uniref:SPOR domain-containing protein n=1 Tax=Phenylobacterium sp. TaxID=1871053 RepID=UPI00391DA11C
MRRAILAAVLLSAGPAAAQIEAPAVTFPESLEREALAAWLARDTDIRPQSVVAVTPDMLTAVIQTRLVGTTVAVVVRGEALTPEGVRDGVLSWHATVQVDCAAGRVRQGATTGYPVRNLLFEGRQIRDPDAGWIAPRPGDALDQVRRAACEPAFKSPLLDEAVLTPQAVAPPPAAPAPAAVKAVPQPPPAAPPAPKAVPQAQAGRFAVQVVAAGSPAEAEQVLKRLRTRLPEAMADRPTAVVQAVVNGKTYHRALVTGFAQRAEAAAFCTALKAANQACFVRAD